MKKVINNRCVKVRKELIYNKIGAKINFNKSK